MATQSFKAIIEIVNKATAPLRQINRDVAKTTAGFRSIGRSVAALGEEAGLARLGEAVEGVKLRMEGLGKVIGGIIAPLAGIGELAAVGGMVELARAAGEYGEQMELASQKTGLVVAALEPLHYIAKLVNLDASRLDNGLFRLNTTIANAARGKNKDALALFQKLHISLRDSHKQVITAATAFPQITAALSKSGNAAFKASAMTALFGGRIARDLMPVLDMAGNKVRELTEKFTRLHGTLSESGLQALARSAEAWKNLSVAVDGLKIAIGARLAPVLTPLIEKLTNWIAANRDLISIRVSEWVHDFGTALSSIPWSTIGSAISLVGEAFAFVSGVIGPFATHMAVAAAASSALLVPIGMLTVAFIRLNVVAAITAVRLAVIPFAAVAAAISSFVTAIRAGYGAMAAFNLVLAANPLGLAIAGVTALAGAAFLIYKYWKPITAFFKDVWSGVVAVFEWVWEKIKPIVLPLLKLLGITAIGDAIASAFSGYDMSPAPAHAAAGAGGGATVISTPVIQRLGGRGAAAPSGAVTATVDFKNVPQGVKVSTQRSGQVDLETRVGRRMLPGT